MQQLQSLFPDSLLSNVVLIIFCVVILSVLPGYLIKIPTNIKFTLIDEITFWSEQKESQMHNRFVNYTSSLKNLGFELIGSSIWSFSPTVTNHLQVYWHKELKIIATCNCINDQMVYLEYSQGYNDNSLFCISNNDIPGAYPKIANKQAYRFPKIESPNELLNIFKELSHHLKQRHTALDYDTKKGFLFLETYFRYESDQLVKLGIAKPDIDQNGKRSPTLYGAIYLTFSSIGRAILDYTSKKEAKDALTACRKNSNIMYNKKTKNYH